MALLLQPQPADAAAELQQGQQEVARFIQSLREDARIQDNRAEVLRRTS